LTEDDPSADQRAALAQLAKSALIETAAREVVSIGHALFKHGDPSDPNVCLKRIAVKNPGCGFGSKFLGLVLNWVFGKTPA